MRQFIINLIKSIGYHLEDRDNLFTPLTLINEAAVRDSYEFINSRMGDAALFSDSPELRRTVFDRACDGIDTNNLILEFGVFKGRTINQFADQLQKKGINTPIYGFDAFEGLQEDWSQLNFGRGAFDLSGKLPKVRKNAQLIKGWVQDTLDDFLSEQKGREISFMHLDMDTYLPTKYVLEKTRSFCRSGTIILFDELYGYPNWRKHEYKALCEVYDESQYSFIAFGKLQSAIQLK